MVLSSTCERQEIEAKNQHGRSGQCDARMSGFMVRCGQGNDLGMEDTWMPSKHCVEGSRAAGMHG